MSKHFDIDLAAGKLREDAFARVLLAGREKFEHKRDFKCATTRNVALEYETSELPNGKGKRWPSGPADNKEAHWLVLEFDEDHRLVVPLEKAKDLMRVAIRAGHHKWVGDNNRFHNALVPVVWFVAASAVDATSAIELDAWQNSLPTDQQARDYARDGTFIPDEAGWAA